MRALNNTYRCICPISINGHNCELKYDACSFYNPCQNGASCDLVDSSYACTCPPWYTGEYCESYFSVCDSNPCGLNGGCYELAPGNYTCFCNRGYTGHNCDQIINVCLSNRCVNGVCSYSVNNYKYNYSAILATRRNAARFRSCHVTAIPV